VDLSLDAMREIREATEKIARGVGVRGLVNIQFAIEEGKLFVLEANPRASRTVPFVSKAIGVPLAKAAAQISLGKSISGLRNEGLLPNQGDGVARGISVKEAVLPWNRFRKRDGSGVDALLGPEMRSTGEVMGRDSTFGRAFSKSQSAASGALPNSGSIFVSFADRDKAIGIAGAKKLFDAGYQLFATAGTARALQAEGIDVVHVRKFSEGKGPNGENTALDLIESGSVGLVVNTPFGSGPREDGWRIRTSAVARGIPIITTISGLHAAAEAMVAQRAANFTVTSLQEWLG